MSYKDGISTFSNYPGWPTSRQTDEEDLQLKARSNTVVSVFTCKLKALANSRGSYPLADMETSNSTLNQVHSIFIRQTCRNFGFDKFNSTCTYYVVNKHVHTISAYFLDAASDKHMRLLTSLYGATLYPPILYGRLINIFRIGRLNRRVESSVEPSET